MRLPRIRISAGDYLRRKSSRRAPLRNLVRINNDAVSFHRRDELAFANRQVITHQIREAFTAVFITCTRRNASDLMSHNIARWSVTETRSDVPPPKAPANLRAGESGTADCYQRSGQPGHLPRCGSMGSAPISPGQTNRAMRRHLQLHDATGPAPCRARKPKRSVRGEQLLRDMKQQGILVKLCRCRASLKRPDRLMVTNMVNTVDQAGITKKWRNSNQLAI